MGNNTRTNPVRAAFRATRTNPSPSDLRGLRIGYTITTWLA